MRTDRFISRNGDHQWPPRSYDLTPCDFFLGVLLNHWYMSINPEISATKRRKFDELSGSHSEFRGQSSCIPALQRWSYAQHHFAYLKWEGELIMFIILLSKVARLMKDPVYFGMGELVTEFPRALKTQFNLM